MFKDFEPVLARDGRRRRGRGAAHQENGAGLVCARGGLRSRARCGDGHRPGRRSKLIALRSKTISIAAQRTDAGAAVPRMADYLLRANAHLKAQPIAAFVA